MSTKSGSMRNPLRRDDQQWLLDLAIKQTGREINFEYEGRRFPAKVKSHAMIPAAMLQLGMHSEAIARQAEAHGHRETALALYYRAQEQYHLGQHAIFEDDHPDKIYLYERLTGCYDRVRALADYRIELVEIPWEGVTFSANFHIHPGDTPRPTILYVPGMDQVKETHPDPTNNLFLKRGMNVLCIDGPGQGSSNMRKIRVTADNYERAGSAAIDFLVSRKEVDAERIGVMGCSMGSYWSMRLAGLDKRVKAVASAAANYAGKRHIFERSSPRFKQIFMYMSGIDDEDQFDRMAETMHLYDTAGSITAACLMMAGEYDPLSPLDETLEVFSRVAGPKELWVMEDDFHGSGKWGGTGLSNLGGLMVFPIMADWLSDILTGKRVPEGERKILIPNGKGEGPYSPEVPDFTLRTRTAR